MSELETCSWCGLAHNQGSDHDRVCAVGKPLHVKIAESGVPSCIEDRISEMEEELMGDKEKDQTTRWNNVKGRALFLHEHTDRIALLNEFGGPMAPGGVFAMALCEEMDRMQEELTYAHNLVEELREKVWKPIEEPPAGKELSDDMIYDTHKRLQEEIDFLRERVDRLATLALKETPKE